MQLHRQILAAVSVQTIAVPATVVGVAPIVRHSLTKTVVGMVRYSSSEVKGTKRKKKKKLEKDAPRHSESSNNTTPEKLTKQMEGALKSTSNLHKGAASSSSIQNQEAAVSSSTAEETLPSQDPPDFYTRSYIPFLGTGVTC